MNRSSILQKLAAAKPALSGLGIDAVYLFGSACRDEMSEDSDVDVLVDFVGAPTFDAYMDTKFLLERTLGRKVDLVTRNALKRQLRPKIEAEALRAA